MWFSANKQKRKERKKEKKKKQNYYLFVDKTKREKIHEAFHFHLFEQD